MRLRPPPTVLLCRQWSKIMRQVLLYPGEDSFWVAECPSLPGCISQGKTRTEAVKQIREAIDLYIETLEEDGLPVPAENFRQG